MDNLSMQLDILGQVRKWLDKHERMCDERANIRLHVRYLLGLRTGYFKAWEAAGCPVFGFSITARRVSGFVYRKGNKYDEVDREMNRWFEEWGVLDRCCKLLLLWVDEGLAAVRRMREEDHSCGSV